jgi:hypothetical protein
MNYQCVWILACVAGLTMPHDQERSFAYNAIGDLFFVATIYVTLSSLSVQLDHCYDKCPNQGTVQYNL